MFWSDVDESLVWKNRQALADSRQALDVYAAQTFSGFCTARGLESGRGQADDLDGFPMNAYATNNGQSLFWKPAGQTTRDFILTVQQTDEDPHWAEQVRHAGGNWSLALIQSTMREVAVSEGFQPAQVELPSHYRGLETWARDTRTSEGDELQVLCISKDQSQFFTRSTHGSITALQGHNDHLVGLLTSKLQDQGLRFSYEQTPPGKGRIINTFQPDGIDKLALLRHVLKQYPSIRAVVTIGDNINDHHLEPTLVEGVPNYPVLGGTQHPHYAELCQHPHMIVCPKGEVASGIRQHMAEIDALVIH